MKNKIEKQNAPPGVEPFKVTIVSVLIVFFFWQIFGTFRVIGQDTEHKGFFVGPLHVDGIKREAKKERPNVCLIIQVVATKIAWRCAFLTTNPRHSENGTTRTATTRITLSALAVCYCICFLWWYILVYGIDTLRSSF